MTPERYAELQARVPRAVELPPIALKPRQSAPKRKAKMAGSPGEIALANQLDAAGIRYEREYRFDPNRRWRLDFAIAEVGQRLAKTHKLAVEVEGGHWLGTKGRHTNGAGFEADCEKYNRLACLGWRLIRVTPKHVSHGEAMKWIKEALE